MGLRDWVRASKLGQQVRQLAEQLSIERNNNSLLQESVSDLERNLFDPEWIRFTALAEQEFSLDGLKQLRAICTLFAIQNPLVKQGLALRSGYVWSQGVEITARANGRRRGEQDVQQVVDAFLNDPHNQRAYTGAEARDQLEHALGTEGEVFTVLFTRPLTGAVQPRTISPNEIVEIIRNPEDATEPWYYRRQWLEVSYNREGWQQTQARELLYPCVDYRPRTRPRRLGDVQIKWDAPILHTAVNRPRGWSRGIPDAYAAIDWARAYKTFLEDWATLVKSLSRFAWRLTAKGSARRQAQQKLAAPPPLDPATGKAQDAGATAITPMDAVLEAIPKSGATIDSESGRPLAAMVASALGVPVTMLLGDPGTTGNRATAETLNQPTRLAMQQRRTVWQTTLQRILEYVITEAVRAPEGVLKGVLRRDPYYDREMVELAGNTTMVIDFAWPPLEDTDPIQLVKAVVEAHGTGVIPPEEILRLLLTALGVRQVDELVEQMTDDITGEFRYPGAAPLGQRAADRARAGGDPAAIGPGPMGDDEPGEPDEPEDDEDEEPPEEP